MQEWLRAGLIGPKLVTRYGLLQNDYHPTPLKTMADIQPADFSGYVGLQEVTTWNSPTITGEVAQIILLPISWYRGAGAVSNWIFGYYVVDSAGELLWSERVGDWPGAMLRTGDRYSVIPSFSQTTRFEE